MILVYLLLTLILLIVILLLVRKDNVVTLTELKSKYETPSSNYFDFKGLNCHYTDDGEGEVVVLIHGLGDSFKMFDKLTPLLRKTYRVLRIDLPGFGLSEIPQNFNQIEDPIDFYRSFVKHFVETKNLKSFHLMGNSLGGLVSWEFATHNQDRLLSLCLLASAGYEMDAVKKNITKGVLTHIPRFILKKGMPINMAKQNTAMVLNQKVNRTAPFIQTHYDMINREGVLNFFLDLVSFNEVPLTDELKSLKTPTLIAWGDRDKIVPTRHAGYFERDISNSEKLIYSNCGHYPQVEYTEQFLQDWQSFVSKI